MIKNLCLLAIGVIMVCASFAKAGSLASIQIPIASEAQLLEITNLVATKFECSVRLGPDNDLSSKCGKIACRKVLSGGFSPLTYTYACEVGLSGTKLSAPLTLSYDAAQSLVEGLMGKCIESNKVLASDGVSLLSVTVECTNFNSYYSELYPTRNSISVVP